ncbi:hypothetical protein D3C86_2199040 [compost metagenome]
MLRAFGHDDAGPHLLKGLYRAGDYHNGFVRTPAGWRLCFNDARLLFEQATN